MFKKAIGIIALGAIAFCGYMAISGYISSRDTVGVAHEAFDLINEERQSLGIVTLSWDNELEELAIQYSQHMNDTGDFKHSGYNYAENILKGADVFANGYQVYNPWERSPRHYMIMTDSGLHDAAIGIVVEYATFLAR